MRSKRWKTAPVCLPWPARRRTRGPGDASRIQEGRPRELELRGGSRARNHPKEDHASDQVQGLPGTRIERRAAVSDRERYDDAPRHAQGIGASQDAQTAGGARQNTKVMNLTTWLAVRSRCTFGARRSAHRSGERTERARGARVAPRRLASPCRPRARRPAPTPGRSRKGEGCVAGTLQRVAGWMLHERSGYQLRQLVDQAIALEMFCYRIRKYVGAYLAALGGAEAIVFTGVIGERSPEVPGLHHPAAGSVRGVHHGARRQAARFLCRGAVLESQRSVHSDASLARELYPGAPRGHARGACLGVGRRVRSRE